MPRQEIAREIGNRLKDLPGTWDGRQAILEMRDAGSHHWKQMEWIGFYFQFLCERYLHGLLEIPGPKYGNVTFDGFKAIPWDFKAHAANTSSHQIIVNDSEATADAIRDYEAVGVILSIGNVLYNDQDRTFQTWHDALKGAKSKYEVERVRRGAWSRLRKVSFDLLQVCFLGITDAALVKCGSFQTDFRNADGSPRRAKVLIDLEQIDDELVHFINFKGP